MYRNLEKQEIIPTTVSFSDYLPNHMRSSPLKKEYSHSYTTSKLKLRKSIYDLDDKKKG